MFSSLSPCQLKCFPLVHLNLPHHSLFYPPSPTISGPSDPSYASVVLHVKIPSWSWQSVAPSIKKNARSLKSPSLTAGQKTRTEGGKTGVMWNWRLLHVRKWDGGRVKDDLLSSVSKLMRWMENCVWNFEGSPTIFWKMVDVSIKFCVVSQFQTYGPEQRTPKPGATIFHCKKKCLKFQPFPFSYPLGSMITQRLLEYYPNFLRNSCFTISTGAFRNHQQYQWKITISNMKHIFKGSIF